MCTGRGEGVAVAVGDAAAAGEGDRRERTGVVMLALVFGAGRTGVVAPAPMSDLGRRPVVPERPVVGPIETTRARAGGGAMDAVTDGRDTDELTLRTEPIRLAVPEDRVGVDTEVLDTAIPETRRDAKPAEALPLETDRTGAGRRLGVDEPSRLAMSHVGSR